MRKGFTFYIRYQSLILNLNTLVTLNMLLKLDEPHFFSPHNVANNKYMHSPCLFAFEALSSIFTGFAISLFFFFFFLSEAEDKAGGSYFSLYYSLLNFTYVDWFWERIYLISESHIIETVCLTWKASLFLSFYMWVNSQKN